MATRQHYLWASGHFLLLFAALRYILATLTFKAVSTWWYKASFAGALFSYAIVCHKSLGTPQASPAYFKRAVLDENVQYFLLAWYWWTSKPVLVALIPYTIFSAFHALTFTRTTLMPQFLPATPSASGQPQPHPAAKRLQAWVKAHYDEAMNIVAYSEILIFIRVLLGAITFRNSFLAPIIYAHFLRQRFYQSAYTRHAFTITGSRITAQIQAAGNPPLVVNVWEKAQLLATRWVGTVLPGTPGNAPAAGARR